ncbi:U-box domain-containing protein 35-like isoform X2 [Malania oleifera]|uniref:U-box domain-containing protein 35-like isoform X2 n=1 Tax=Malania oleifera TaxID=397392 RepID=UPI0025ADF5CB|nr:U-box domain-containing protein 35-like isoform X2 [Malania oleifera]XP_057952290.1 U-box domain-containing protein 35-like isoform X2 [Malania oleifera]
MGESRIVEAEEEPASAPPNYLNVAVAVNGSIKSKQLVNWALEKFNPERKVMLKLIYVRARIIAVPTPMGYFIPISKARDDVAAAYKEEVEWQTCEKLLPFKKMCAQQKVPVDITVIESDDIANAIAGEVAKCTINRLVIGVSTESIFRRKCNGRSLSSRISECTPSFCTVYAVSKGKLSSVRQSKCETIGSIIDDSSDASFRSNSSSSCTSSSQTDLSSVASFSHLDPPSQPAKQFQAHSTANQTLLIAGKYSQSDCQSEDTGEEDDVTSYSTGSSGVEHLNNCIAIYRSQLTDNQSWITDQASTSNTPDFSSENQLNINFELERLRIELRHVQGMYAVAQSETLDASHKLNNLNKHQLEQAVKLEELRCKENEAKELAREEKEKYEAAKREAEYVRECAEVEALQRKEAQSKAFHEASEKEKLEDALVGHVQQYQTFTWEEIVSATSSFSENLRVGMGAYGVVYKGSFHYTTAAVKVLHTKDSPKTKQFQQELEILSKIRHPHLLLLIGACPDHGCLVYEYMENGSLEERLLRKKDTPPIPWFERFRIAWEVASALVFLHNSKPDPIVHRDLKPANILLDHNFVSKIGDVGLSMMLHQDESSFSNMYKDTGIAGTLCYIDPEYQRTGRVSPKSDVYAFGMVILQLLTAKPAIALTHVVETAIDDGHLMEILDPEAGTWPIEETKELATLALCCAELRRKDRPDLKDEVLPALERLKEVTGRARDLPSGIQLAPPNHFICPIQKMDTLTAAKH